MPKILIVDDEADIRELVRFALQSVGLSDTIEAADGREAIALARKEHPDLILLDLMMPGVGGLDVCKTLQADPQTVDIPIVILSALGDEADIVCGLELGASDYVTKPFSRRILAARVRAQLRARETVATALPPSDCIRCGKIEIDRATRTVRLEGKRMEEELTAGEFDTLALFASTPGRVYTRTQIIDKIKGEDYAVTDRSVDVMMVSLRHKLGAYSALIETVRGVGYRMHGIESGEEMR